MSNIGDKFQLVTDPYLMPQKCASCNTQKMTEYIDFGLNILRYGRVYFCKECFMEASAALHMTIPVSPLLIEIEKLKEENANLTHLLTVDLHGLHSYLDDVLSKSEVAEQISRADDGQVKRGPGRPKRANTRIVESNSE